MEEETKLERIKDQGEHEEEDMAFPGFRFHPTDQELVGFYLTRKVEKKAFSIDIIKEIDIYKHDPWDLPKESSHVQVGGGGGGAGEKECYFFCLRGRKYRNSIRPNRVTGSGFWKATGIDKPIYPTTTKAGGGECVGLKKSLVYYRGSAGKGTKTDWMMHEFRLPSPPPAAIYASSNDSFQDAEIWTICRIFKRSISYSKRSQQQKQQPHHHHQQQQQQQLDSYSYYHHQSYDCSSASMATSSSFESNADGRQPYILGFSAGASSSSASTASGMGAPPASTGWGQLMSFRDGSS